MPPLQRAAGPFCSAGSADLPKQDEASACQALSLGDLPKEAIEVFRGGQLFAFVEPRPTAQDPVPGDFRATSVVRKAARHLGGVRDKISVERAGRG